MSIDADIRELRGHVMGLVGSFNQFTGRVEEKLEGIEITLTTHTRPCPDLIYVRKKVEELAAKPSGNGAQETPAERGLLKFVLAKIVVLLVVALTGGFTAVVAYAFVKGG